VQGPEQSPLRAGGAFLSMMAALALVWLPVQAGLREIARNAQSSILGIQNETTITFSRW